MSLYNYRISVELSHRDMPIEALIMAAMAKADDQNMAKLRAGWPQLWGELRARHHAPGGLLGTDVTASGQLDPHASIGQAPTSAPAMVWRAVVDDHTCGPCRQASGRPVDSDLPLLHCENDDGCRCTAQPETP